MTNKEVIIKVLQSVDEILLDYIERVEKAEKAGLYHGRGVALSVKVLLAKLKE